MIVVQNNISVKEEYREQFEKMFRERAHLVDDFPGFVRNEVMRPIKGEEYIVMTHWESMDHFQKWMESDSFKKAHGGQTLPKEAFAGENRITIHEVFTSSS